MPKQVQLRRGTTAQHSAFTGAVGEVTVDTTKRVPVVHDGATAGGVPSAKESDLTTLKGRVDGLAVITRTSDGAISQYAIVKIGSDASHVTPWTSATVPLGIALDAAGGAGVSIRVALLTGGETPRKMIASAAITAGSILEPTGAIGKVQLQLGTVGTHHLVGMSLSASAADGDLIDVAPFYMLRVI